MRSMPVKRLVNLLVTFKQERNRHDAHRQDAHRLSLTCNDRCGTRTRTTAHTGCDKHHFSTIVEHVVNLLHALLGRLAGPCRTVAGTKALLAYLQAHRHWRVGQCLRVGVTHHKVHIVNTLTVHVVNGITAATAHTDNLYNRRRGSRHAHIYQQIVVIIFCHDFQSLLWVVLKTDFLAPLMLYTVHTRRCITHRRPPSPGCQRSCSCASRSSSTCCGVSS